MDTYCKMPQNRQSSNRLVDCQIVTVSHPIVDRWDASPQWGIMTGHDLVPPGVHDPGCTESIATRQGIDTR